MIEINLNDGTTFFIIDRPKNFISDIFGKPSTTISRLLEEYPDLDGKITVENLYNYR